MEIIHTYTELIKQFEIFSEIGRNEVLSNMLQTDAKYESLCSKRADASMALKGVLVSPNMEVLFEKYSDTVCEQEIYELDAIYKQAFSDAFNFMREQDLLK